MPDHTLLGPWIRRFLLEHLAIERNLSPNTRASYRDMLVQLLPYAARHVGRSVDRLMIADLGPTLIRAFLSDIEDTRHCSAATRNQRLAGIHALARFIGENSPEHVQWCTQIRLIPFKKTTQGDVSYLDESQMNALLAAPDRSTAQGRRDYALLLFLYNSGARATEACTVRINDIDWHLLSVRLLGKGNKYRTCPLWPRTIEQLRLCAGSRHDEELLFVNRNGQPMTRFGIHTMVERHAANAAIQICSFSGRKVSPHIIRHSTATGLLRSGVDINTVRAWLGHVSINTTNIYAETDLETKARALDACAPDGGGEQGKRWREQPELMSFLRTL
ncbi:tyrosine-type recombinase/integrase [Cupriavidus pinatubonensis]|uniref:Tyrosine recombinase XerC n=1 Tax=Cupriavidus pinatubonensis TaxID=248026 RepID=A0ABM8Y453_9BURK|nr:tyrosine-type recombinase/integrase [Cupriavidus pinatubonensis]CAG9187533.1 Tyrosine recombinase XerC [Cupriavidus pinatubonensis]